MARSELIGAREYSRQLANLDKKYATQSVRRALRSVAKFFLPILKSAAKSVSGKTLESLRLRAGKRKKNHISMLVGATKNTLDARDFYLGFADQGHEAGGKSKTKGANYGKTTGKPAHEVEGTYWAEKAFASAQEQMLSRLSDELGKELARFQETGDVDGGDE